MRITTGKYKGRVIKMPKGIRPTQGLVRKALFDILGDITGLSFLELFAGSGAVGLEALSRGAKEVVLVEKDRQCIKVIEENLNSLKCQGASHYVILRQAQDPSAKDTGQSRSATSPGHQSACELAAGNLQPAATIINKDVLAIVPVLSRRQQIFGLIFLDPPYYKEMGKKTLKILGAYDILSPNGLVVAQHFKKDVLPDKIGNLAIFRQAKYGDTILSFYKRR